MIAKTYGGFLVSRIKQVGGAIFQKLLAQAGVDAFNGAQGRILARPVAAGQYPDCGTIQTNRPGEDHPDQHAGPLWSKPGC